MTAPGRPRTVSRWRRVASRLGRVALYALPLALLAVVASQVYQFPFSNWPFPAKSFDAPLVRRASQVPVALAGLFAPLPLCLAESLRWRSRGAGRDAGGRLMIQLAVLVAVEVSVFLTLACLGALTRPAFLGAEGAIALVGLAWLVPIASRSRPRVVRRHVAAYTGIVLALGACGLASVHLGRDNSWDLINYHYYNGHAFLRGRQGFDLGVANMETYLNPLLDAAYYVLIGSVRPVWVGFVAGAVHGVAAVLLYGIALETLGRSRAVRRVRTPLALACAVAGVGEPIFLGQLGTTLHDNLLASFALAALWLMIRLRNRGSNARHSVSLLAGALVGLAAGFKLTMATYAVGGVVALLAIPAGWKRGLSLGVAFGAGVVPGFLVTNGYWMARLASRYGSPIFPFYNALFRSPYWPDHNTSYLHVTADLLWYDHLLMPFSLAEKTRLLSEVPSRDLALATACVLLGLVAVGRVVELLRADWRNRSSLRDALTGPLPPGAALLFAFVAASTLVWYAQFRILRYFVVVQVLLPLACVLLTLDLFRSGRRVWVASAVILPMLAAGSCPAYFGRLEWKESFFAYDLPAIEGHRGGIVLTTWVAAPDGGSSPFTSVLPMLPQEMRYIKIDSPQVANPFQEKPLAMDREVTGLIRTHEGPFFLLAHDTPKANALNAAILEKYGLAVDERQAPKAINGFNLKLGYWRLERRPVAVAAARQGASH